MPDSIRDLLQGIAGGEPAPSTDLAAGAYRRARRIARRRFAAAAIAAVTGLALASVTTAALVNADDFRDTPPAVEHPPSADTTPAPTETTTEGEQSGGACNAPVAWDGWGDSASIRPLERLPETLYFELRPEDGSVSPQIVRLVGEETSSPVIEDAYGHYLAPDGERYAVANDGCDGSLANVEEGVAIDGLGIFATYCEPVWSPDSNLVVLNRPDPANEDAYLMDTATGEVIDLPIEVGCASRWSADGEYLVSADGGTAMRPDGTGAVALAGLGEWTQDPRFVGVSSISADLSLACLQFADAEGEVTGHAQAVRCDRFVDTGSGEELPLPIDVHDPQVVFLPDGSTIVSDDRVEEVEVSLLGPDGNVRDSRVFAEQSPGEVILRGYFTE